MKRSTMIWLLTGCWLGMATDVAWAQEEKKAKTGKAKKAKKAENVVLDPFDRPDGSIVDQPARFYVWIDEKSWKIRTTAHAVRSFSGTIRVSEGGRIASCVGVGLRTDGRQAKKNVDQWQISGDRKELKFSFKTAAKSDGFDMKVEGDNATLEFDLAIDGQKKPAAVFVGKKQQHPGELPFKLPAVPKRPDAEKVE